MFRFRRARLAPFCFLALAACAGSPRPQPSAPLSSTAIQGRVLAETHCSRCHAIAADGESSHPMAPPFRSLSRNYPVNSLEEAFAEGIMVGHRDMPRFELEPAQIDAVVAYLSAIQERPAR
ncbi:MAG: cytochrome c [Terricaulis sp.]